MYIYISLKTLNPKLYIYLEDCLKIRSTGVDNEDCA